MKISKNKNTTILTNNNLSVLDLFGDEKVIMDINEVKNIKDSFVIFNDVLRNLKEKDLEILFEILKQKNIHFVNITSDIEEVLFTDYLLIFNDNKIIVEGPVLSVLREEKILKRLGYKLPFVVDLSLQLNYYGLIDSIYLDERALVDKLW